MINDKELFKKCKEIWNRITKLLGINNAPDFVRTNSNDDDFIIADVHENTSLVKGNCVLVLDSIFNDYPKTLLIQAKKNINALIKNI